MTHPNPQGSTALREALEHDDFCAKTRFWSAKCDCGAEDAQEIVRDVCTNFAKDLKEIFRAPR